MGFWDQKPEATGSLLKEISGVPVHVREDGKFNAVIDGKLVTRSSLAAIEGVIRATQTPVNGFAYSTYLFRTIIWLIDAPRSVKVRGKTQKGWALLDGMKTERGERVYVAVPGVQEELDAVYTEAAAALEGWKKRIRDALAKTSEVRATDFNRGDDDAE